MRVLVTGASGWIGSAVVPELIGSGHQVIGLARSDASADALTAAGAEVQLGSLDDLDGLRSAAASADGVIHLAFKHDLAFSGDFDGAVAADRRAIEAFGDALAGTDKPFVIASGLLGVAPGRVATEDDGRDTQAAGSGLEGRHANAQLALSLADRGVRSSVLRLPPTVHGEGNAGFVSSLIDIAVDKGVSAYIGGGTNRWPAVHRLDSASLFRLGLEKAPAGSVLHAVGDEGVPIRDIAAAIGEYLGLAVVDIAPDDAGTHFGWLAGALALDSPASAVQTQKLLDWRPTQPGLVEDIAQGHPFTGAPA
ncbi:SDR family oxidoreductase [soil metagenome]